jgi:serine/threonine-protein kinase HipA
MKNIEIYIKDDNVGELFFEKEANQYGFNYISSKHQISLIMPHKSSSYIWKNKLHPLFDMYMPEGYLFELFKNYLSKEYGYIDDYLIFSHLCSNIQSRLDFRSDTVSKKFDAIDLDYILKNDSNDTFSNLMKIFMDKNAISGIQPKTIAIIDDKESFGCKEYIIKTWGDEYPQLALNEYFCLKAVEDAGVQIPKILLSKNNKFLLVQRFNYDQKTDTFLGFEEILGLMGKNKESKYSSSYEQISKIVYQVSTHKNSDMISLYKIIVMNYLLKNGDGHLKNFGVLYDDNFQNIYLAPAYDIVNTVVYFHQDRPALSMFGKKLWFGKKELIRFGVNHCYLSNQNATKYYTQCTNSVQKSINHLKSYIDDNQEFKDIGTKIIQSWQDSLKQTTQKELSDDIARDWK